MNDVSSELRALYGSEALCTRGVVQPMFVVRADDGLLHPVRIGPGAPTSPTDFFVLNLCRARADAILTSAENLRREQGLTMRLEGPWAPTLSRFRVEQLGKAVPPLCVLLTRSGDLPLEHPLWSDGCRKLVLTSVERAPGLQHALGSRAEVAGVDELDARAACALLHARGAGLISVEAGPSLASALYEEPSLVDELLVSEWLDWDGAPLAAALPPDERLFANLAPRSESERLESGKRFRFQRWAR